MPTSDRTKSLAGQARAVFMAHGYNRQGGKGNRRQQMERACSVMDWVQRHCQVHHLGQLGGRQVVQFWKSHRELAPATSYGYWLALCKLWELAGKSGVPPKHFPSPTPPPEDTQEVPDRLSA